MANTDILRLSRELREAFEHAKPINPPSSRYDNFDLKAGYAVAAELAQWRRQRGETTLGRKIGFTNHAIWDEFGLDTPIWGYVYDSTLYYSQHDHTDLSLSGTVLPRIEPEIVFKLCGTPVATDAKPAEVLRSVEWVALGFEMVDSHYPDWNFKPADAVADFGVHAALVVGTPLVLTEERASKLAGQLRTFEVSLSRQGKLVARGIGKNVLGHPALALAHLAQILQQHPAEPLGAGEIITTGTLTAACPVTQGQTWSAMVTGIDLPPLEVTLLA